MKMQALEMEAERTILEQLRAGNYEAFEQIYDRYSPKLTGNLVRLLKDRDLAAECLQEIFVRLWEHRGSIDPEKSIKAYLFRISENMVRCEPISSPLPRRLMTILKKPYSTRKEDNFFMKP